ncbi:MAG: Asp-tRNA(Asn)/Glu-tRNA(Gln) amidotransferase subunit GatC, partial [Actinomycetota bacterium]
RSRMQEELTHILAHVERIQALDLADVAPTSHAVPLTNVMRADEVRPSLDPGDALANAPEREDGRFKVPRILEEG